MTIQELLAEYAEGARTYDVGAGALQIGRRHRMMARAVPVAVALAVVVAGGAIALVPRPHATHDPVPPATSPVWKSDQLKPSDFPARIVPQPSAPALPTTGIGRGVWIYWYSDPVDTRQYLVAADGRQYRLEHGAAYGLSPDGRWLVGHVTKTAANRATLRDLAGDRTFDIAPDQIVWSPDGRWMATITAYLPDNAATDRTVRVVDLANPGAASAMFTMPLVDLPLSVTEGGDLVVAVTSSTTGVFEIVIRDRRTGVEKRKTSVDYTVTLTGEELQATTEAIAGRGTMAVGASTVAISDGRLLVQAMRRSGNVIVDGPVVSVDLMTGAATRAFVLSGGIGEVWSLRKVLADGSLMLVHTRDGRLISFDRYDPVTQQRTQLTDLTAVSG
jgi:hypothetical protein